MNKWNFETDTLPQEQYDEQGKEIYQEKNFALNGFNLRRIIMKKKI